VKTLLSEGHELGCHTFEHNNSSTTRPEIYAASLIKNREALSALIPGARFRTFSYPFCLPAPRIKKGAGEFFECCRSGGQTFITGTADLNHLAAFFLEQSRERPQAVRDVIDQNRRAGGWLILATHDISDKPSRFGCTPEFFREVVQYATRSGAQTLPVAEALDVLKRRVNTTG